VQQETPPKGVVPELAAQLKDLQEKRASAKQEVQEGEKRLATIKVALDVGLATLGDYAKELLAHSRRNEELMMADMKAEVLANFLREHETRPTGPLFIVTALPKDLAAAAAVRITEYGEGGKVVGSLTADERMATLFLARSRTDNAAPKEVRVVVADGSTLGAAFSAVAAVNYAGFTKVKFTGTIPTKFNVPAGRKDLPRQHLQEHETDKLYKTLRAYMMTC
jgi:hypothetical protein